MECQLWVENIGNEGSLKADIWERGRLWVIIEAELEQP